MALPAKLTLWKPVRRDGLQNEPGLGADRGQDRAGAPPVRIAGRDRGYRGRPVSSRQMGAADGATMMAVMARIKRKPGRDATQVLTPNMKGYEAAARRRMPRRSGCSAPRSESFQPEEHQLLASTRASSASRPVVDRLAAEGMKVRGAVSVVVVLPLRGRRLRRPRSARSRQPDEGHRRADDVALADTIGVGTPTQGAGA